MTPHKIQKKVPAFLIRAGRHHSGLRGPNLSNSFQCGLEPSIINGVTVDRLKAELDRFLSSLPDQFTVQGR